MAWKGLQYSLYHLRDPKLEGHWIIEATSEDATAWVILFDGEQIWSGECEQFPEIMTEYIKTPLKKLDLINDHKTGLVKQLKAMDRRVGRKKWWEILRKNPDPGIRKVVQYRIDIRDKDKRARLKKKAEERRKHSKEYKREERVKQNDEA